MDQGCGSERVVGRFAFHALTRQLAQFIIYHRQKLTGGFGVARVDGLQNFA
jgi:hypothetical protein